MMTVAWALLAVLVLVLVPRLGAEEIKIIGRDFAFDAPATLGAGVTTFVFEMGPPTRCLSAGTRQNRRRMSLPWLAWAVTRCTFHWQARASTS